MNVQQNDVAPLIIAIDDEQFYLDELAYELQGRNIRLKTFRGPDYFEEQATREDLAGAKLILVDYDFKTSTAIDKAVAEYIRSEYPDFSGKIVLFSLLSDFGKDAKAVTRNYDGVMPKENLSWDEIKTYLG